MRKSLRGFFGVLVPLAIAAVGSIAAISAAPEIDPHRGEALNLDRFAITFDEPFDRLSVSAWGPGTRWTAHTPWNGDFGKAVFANPGPDGPFRIVDGILQIEMRQKGGRWQSGLLSANDRRSHGFQQSGGYFEMRAKLPGGPGVWPAFWLGSNGTRDQPKPEVDALEYYGKFPSSYRVTTHIWLQGKNIAGKGQKVDVPDGVVTSGFHTYGVLINEQNVIFYFDRREVARQPSRPELMQPMYPMVNLAAGGGWPIDGMPNPSVMYIDYVRFYKVRP